MTAPAAPAVHPSRPRPMSLDDLVAVLGKPVSDEQAAVVTAPLEAGVVVAGAGSGKTATMVARVVWLVGTGQVQPDEVLGLTFTTKAADEQRQPALGDDDDPTWAHALVERVVDGMSGSDFPATVNEHCARTCSVRASCPAWPEGESVLR